MTVRITYNSQNIDVALAVDGLQVNYKHERRANTAGSGKMEFINLYGITEVSFNAYFSEAVYFTLLNWWSWARQGKTFSLALDSANTGNTTLDAAAAAAQKDIPLTATAAFAAGDDCIIIAADNDDEFEHVDIASVDAGVKVVATSNLINSYTSGDTFRHLNYWPTLTCKDESFLPTRTGVSSTAGAYYQHAFNFIEDK